MNSTFRIARSTKYSSAKFGLSDSIVSISFRAQSSIAANRIACFRSSVRGQQSPGTNLSD